MAKFTATIRHQGRSRTRTIECGDDFAKAKRVALREFGFEQHDYEIVIYGEEAGCSPELVASRRVGSRQWVAPSVERKLLAPACPVATITAERLEGGEGATAINFFKLSCYPESC